MTAFSSSLLIFSVNEPTPRERSQRGSSFEGENGRAASPTLPVTGSTSSSPTWVPAEPSQYFVSWPSLCSGNWGTVSWPREGRSRQLFHSCLQGLGQGETISGSTHHWRKFIIIILDIKVEVDGENIQEDRDIGFPTSLACSLLLTLLLGGLQVLPSGFLDAQV